MVLFYFCGFQVSNISFLIIFFRITFSGDDYLADHTAFPVSVDENNIESHITCTEKTETPIEQLPHGADKDKVRSRKETLFQNVNFTLENQMHDNDSSYNSYETSYSNFIADENLANISLLFALYNHYALALQFI